jgi:hypothetical protein
MRNEERSANYQKAGKPVRTPAQQRRLLKKGHSRKTHEHEHGTGEQKFRCSRCRPYPWKVSTAIRPEAGPRDWS